MYGKAVGAKKYAAVGDVEHPTADGLGQSRRRDGRRRRCARCSCIPAIYDVSVWVVPNPLGQFADSNPNVMPSAHAGRGEDM